tara:strand:- start:55 stop:564 length:510 start_codon:yes stop_codon:yes gene_type:complete
MNNKKITKKLSQQFINGLENYGLTYNEILKSGWKYCGGDTGRHRNYFKMVFPNTKIPEPLFKCVCDHVIMEHCYISNGKNLLTLGNCCIKKFIPKCGRTCNKCEEPHKNRLVNRCNNCRIGICDECDKKCDNSRNKCYDCYIGKKGICYVCKVKCDKKYNKCYKCTFKK